MKNFSENSNAHLFYSRVDQMTPFRPDFDRPRFEAIQEKAATLDNFLSNFMHFGFDSKPTAAQRIKEITVLAREAFKEVSSVLSQSTRAMAAAQLDFISTILDAEPAQKKPESWKNSNPKQGPHSF